MRLYCHDGRPVADHARARDPDGRGHRAGQPLLGARRPARQRTASRIEASFDVAASNTLSETQKARITARCGPVVRAVAQDARSQARNRTLALERLAGRIERALEVQRPRRPTKPTRASRTRRLDAKRRASARKQARRRPSGDDQ